MNNKEALKRKWGSELNLIPKCTTTNEEKDRRDVQKKESTEYPWLHSTP